MKTQSEASVQSKAIVEAYHQAGVSGDLPSFGAFLHPEFKWTAPNYLPWGGPHKGASSFRNVLVHLPETLDFSRFSYDSLTADGTHVVALINIGVVGSDATIKISEHWEVVDGKAVSIWVAYFEPQALLKKLGLEMKL